MRTHAEAAKMLGARTRAAAGRGPEPFGGVIRRPAEDADGLARKLLSGLVPFEELDDILGGMQESTDRLALMAANALDQATQSFIDELEEMDDDDVLFEVDSDAMKVRFVAAFGPSAFVALVQEAVYGLLMAEAKA